MITWIIAGIIIIATIFADILIRVMEYMQIKKQNAQVIKKQITWREYKKKHKHFICGLDNEKCRKDCLMNGIFEREGCMYLKGYRNY